MSQQGCRFLRSTLQTCLCLRRLTLNTWLQTGGYSGADLEAVVREAGLVSLRRDIETKNVTREDFRDALERIKPSITPDMENWYQGFGKRFKKERAPVPIT